MKDSGQQDISEDHNGSKDNDVKQQPSRIYQQLCLQLSSEKVCADFFVFFFPSFFSTHFFSFSPFFFSDFFFSFFFSCFFSLFFSPSFQNKLDKMQVGSSEDVNDLNYYYDNEWWVACGGN